MLNYANHLLQLIDEPAANEIPDDSYFYGLFQCFMPDGVGLEQVFSGLANAEQLYARLLPIYQANQSYYQKVVAKGAVPGYFCPETQAIDASALQQIGQQYLANLKQLALFCQDQSTLERLNQIQQIKLEKPRKKDDVTEDSVYELISQWVLDQPCTEPKLELLGEAYYSIACIYPLAYYLQYPSFSHKPECDVLAPYFELWRNGYRAIFCDNCLYIYPA